MKIKTLAIAAGISAPLILSGPASGGFVGIKVTTKPNAFGLLVVNVYADFDRPGQDHMLSVSGTPQSPLIIAVVGGTFYNHAFGNDNAPSPALVAAFPSLAFDSFVTIGKKLSTGNQLTITPGFPGVTGSSLSTISSGWAITPNHPQGNPFDAANSFPGNGQILIGQFSTDDGVNICGTMPLQYISNGVAGQAVVTFGFGCQFCQSDADCDDGDPCTAEVVCNGLICVASPLVPDCNANGALDSCDIANGTSPDCNANGVPDECEADCNGNGVPDVCDLADGTSPDVNGNGLPDDCECLADINGNGGVDIIDFLQLLAVWGPCEPGCFGDVDFDGNVGILDFLLLLANWGPCP